MIEAWHFVGETLFDGRPVPPDGVWLEQPGQIVLCKNGLHASRRAIDALSYAPGSTICRVTLDGTILEDTDKLCAERRRIEWRIDGDALLCAFARRCALDVADLWDMPKVVQEYLETGKDDMRAAAGAAAWNAARTAGAAAWNAAWAAAWAAARDARTAARTAARDAVEAAARTAGAAAWDAAKNAVEAAARDAHNTRLEAMIAEAR